MVENAWEKGTSVTSQWWGLSGPRALMVIPAQGTQGWAARYRVGVMGKAVQRSPWVSPWNWVAHARPWFLQLCGSGLFLGHCERHPMPPAYCDFNVTFC